MNDPAENQEGKEGNASPIEGSTPKTQLLIVHCSLLIDIIHFRRKKPMTNLSKITHWLLRMFVYACMGTSAILLVYDFENSCWFCIGYRNHKAEAKQYIGAMNRAQQAYYLEKSNFSNSINNLGLGIKTDTAGYSYRILSPMEPIQDAAAIKPPSQEKERAIAFATPKRTGFKSYMGIVWKYQNTNGQITTTSLICETGEEGVLYPSNLPQTTNQIYCPPGFVPLR